MDDGNLMDSMDLKVRELLKEVQLDYSPSFTKFVDDTVSAIKVSIDKIPEDVQVIHLPVSLSATVCISALHFVNTCILTKEILKLLFSTVLYFGVLSCE